MAGLSASDLAAELGLSRGRISQLVADGRLDGCYTGEGRARRFDLRAVATALNRRLDAGQMLGNGRATKRALSALAGDDAPDATMSRDEAPAVRRGETLDDRDPDRYELARIQKIEEEARRLRRANAEAEGTMVLASAVHRQVARQIAQEVAEFESVLRDAARQKTSDGLSEPGRGYCRARAV